MDFIKLPVMLDGATGTMLQAAGMPQGVCPEQWILENPEIITKVQSSYVKAGASIVYAPTFGANSVKLGRFGLQNQVYELNTKLVALSKSAIQGKALVAGDLSPLGLFLQPMGDSTLEELIDVYRQQAEALDSAGVDLFVVETFMTIPEARAAVLAIREVSDKPIFVTFTVDENGKTLTGTDILAALTIMQNMEIQAFGLNCSTGPDKMVEWITKMSPYAHVPLIVKPNAGIPHVENGATIFDLSPEDFVCHTVEFLKNGVGILGGCCGTTPEHMKYLKQELDQYTELYHPNKYQELDNELIAATEKECFFIDAAVDIAEELQATSDLMENLLDAEEDTSCVLKIRVDTEEELEYFNEAQYMMKLPVCIVSENAKIFEQTIRTFNGRAIYDGSAPIPTNIVNACVKKYGMITL